jgi:hypothetical protein
VGVGFATPPGRRTDDREDDSVGSAPGGQAGLPPGYGLERGADVLLLRRGEHMAWCCVLSHSITGSGLPSTPALRSKVLDRGYADFREFIVHALG